MDINVSAGAEPALKNAVPHARRKLWLEQNAQAFAAQVALHERNAHPLADIISAPGGSSWRQAGSVADQGDQIVRAVDVLMAGV